PRASYFFFSTDVSVFWPLTSAQRISARSPALTAPATFVASADGIAHVSPATVIDDCDSADTVPFASLFSACVFVGSQLAGPSSTAEPPVALPPILPSVK